VCLLISLSSTTGVLWSCSIDNKSCCLKLCAKWWIYKKPKCAVIALKFSGRLRQTHFQISCAVCYIFGASFSTVWIYERNYDHVIHRNFMNCIGYQLVDCHLVNLLKLRFLGHLTKQSVYRCWISWWPWNFKANIANWFEIWTIWASQFHE
jgi:hypothetical protein